MNAGDDALVMCCCLGAMPDMVPQLAGPKLCQAHHIACDISTTHFHTANINPQCTKKDTSTMPNPIPNALKSPRCYYASKHNPQYTQNPSNILLTHKKAKCNSQCTKRNSQSTPRSKTQSPMHFRQQNTIPRLQKCDPAGDRTQGLQMASNPYRLAEV